MKLSILALAVVAVLQDQQPLPRFRSGANLVTVDAYFTKNGAAVTDLTQAEIEILEDGTPQSIESFRVVRAGAQTAVAKPGAPAPAAAPAPADADASRIFVLFLDTWHVSKFGSFNAGAPVSALVERVIGVNDRVGLMTPELSASGMDLSGRAAGIERLMRESTRWGQRDTVGDVDPRERDIELCYPDNDPQRPQYRGIAKEMIERRREQKTLDALSSLVDRLGTLGDERKFVVLLTEGWVLFRANESLARVLDKEAPVPQQAPIGGTQGTLTRPQAYDRGFSSCERERSMLAFIDHNLELRQLAQRANRANVTFYAIDPRGLTAFDDTIGPLRPAGLVEDRARLTSRQEGLRELALNTDGAVVLNTTDTKAGVARMMGDLSAYYLMQYYSTNAKADGRFRQISVRVKRPGVQVRARPGYLALTAEEMRALTAPSSAAVLPAGAELIKRRLPLVALRRGPSTGLDYVRIEQAQLRRTERLRIEVELAAGAANVAGTLLNNQRQEMPLPVASSTTQSNGQTINRLEVVLSPLAPAPYVLRITYELNGQKEAIDYEFRIVP